MQEEEEEAAETEEEESEVEDWAGMATAEEREGLDPEAKEGAAMEEADLEAAGLAMVDSGSAVVDLEATDSAAAGLAEAD